MPAAGLATGHYTRYVDAIDSETRAAVIVEKDLFLVKLFFFRQCFGQREIVDKSGESPIVLPVRITC